MRALSERQAASCENAKHPRCRCRCGGALHGRTRHGQTTAEILVRLREEGADTQARELEERDPPDRRKTPGARIRAAKARTQWSQMRLQEHEKGGSASGDRGPL